MTKALLLKLGTALSLAALITACSEDGAPPAHAEPAPLSTPRPVAADLPPGDGFDFYVLSLSWSPSYCRAEDAGANPQQCAEDRDFGFVVHGLWPQYESGYPEFCPSREPERVPWQLGRKYIDIVPSMGLIGHQWRKHGSCSGLSQADYFRVLRAARDRVVIPASFKLQNLPLEIDAPDAEGAFVSANPGMVAEGIAISCKRGLLREVRICMTPTLDFRACRAVDRAGCTIDKLEVPEPD
ncbi:ribonuclease [Hoeflea sp. YIM 152468]|uniref:ribonuclease T2 family protein n=1 Tax=Hoeflea sp. YIM 152468 TaxID=3031759 RepID=UPI0023DB8DDC|nr:ribonuclease [Hoeflea sp. YIM 152468]MDF1607199.1 ribonuclease [Hoeflea sp. YIM 152468]